MTSIAKKEIDETTKAKTVKLQHHQHPHHQHMVVKMKTKSDIAVGFKTETRRGGDAYF